MVMNRSRYFAYFILILANSDKEPQGNRRTTKNKERGRGTEEERARRETKRKAGKGRRQEIGKAPRSY
jgi:hypothetical protein